MEFSAEQIAGILSGELVGDPQVKVNGLSKIEEGKESTLTFLANMKYEPYVYKTLASVVIVNNTFEPAKPLPTTLTMIKVPDAYACFAQLLSFYEEMRAPKAKIEQPSFVDETAKVGEGVYIGAFAYIGAYAKIEAGAKIYPNAYVGEYVEIGENSVVRPNASIYHDCKIGKDCVVHAGAVVGADGFGFAPDANGNFQKVPQIGNVILEDRVEIGANCTIDRATLGSTILREGVKIDNLVQVAHNVEIGKNSAMAAQAGVAGSAKIGERVLIGGQAGISGHIKIADDTKIVAQTGVPGNVKSSGKTLMGSPGIPIEDFKKSYFGFRKLPYILNKLRELEEKINR